MSVSRALSSVTGAPPEVIGRWPTWLWYYLCRFFQRLRRLWLDGINKSLLYLPAPLLGSCWTLLCWQFIGPRSLRCDGGGVLRALKGGGQSANSGQLPQRLPNLSMHQTQSSGQPRVSQNRFQQCSSYIAQSHPIFPWPADWLPSNNHFRYDVKRSPSFVFILLYVILKRYYL